MAKKKRARAPVRVERPPGPWARGLRSPWTVAACVFVVYAFFVLRFLPDSHGGQNFFFAGRTFATHSTRSAAIKFDPLYLQSLGPTGYDGQFYYYIALDPINARYYLDTPPYRYTRILYPLAARALALGQSGLVPYTLLLVNLLAIAGGTLAVGTWLKRRGFSPWIALIYGFYPGMAVSLVLDLTEPLGYALVALAVLLLDIGGRHRLVWAGLSFALAILARETTAIFAVVYGVAQLFSGFGKLGWRELIRCNWRPAVLLLAVAGLPMLVYKVFLKLWLGSTGVGDYSLLQVPFHGLAAQWPWATWTVEECRGIVVPACLLGLLALWALWKRLSSAALWALLANIAVCVVQLIPTSYDAFFAPARIATGVMLAALFCLPLFDRLTVRREMWVHRWWLAAGAALWLWLLSDWAGVVFRVFPA